MTERRPSDIDMRADGSFVEPARDSRFTGWPPPGGPRPGGFSRNVAIVGAIVGAVIVAGLALSLALVLVPIAIGAALIGYAALRFQLWRMRSSGTPPGQAWRGQFTPIMAQFEAILRNRRPRR
jgi:hypothetical protein